MRVLVTGGTGYVGSFTVKALQDAGHEVVIYDDVRHGHREAVDAELVVGNILDGAKLDEVLGARAFDAAFHFASLIAVGESMVDPAGYFENNVSGSIAFFSALLRHDVGRVVFSSSAAVYGEAQYLPIDEEHPKFQVNPYGESKWMMERALHWFGVCHGMRSVSLRYFSAAGAALDGSMGEDHEPETHLIPHVIKTALGQRGPLKLFGDDYDTPDGSCVRDYVHVLDLAAAHLAALSAIDAAAVTKAYNVGSGEGYSNLEVIRAVEQASGRKVPYEVGPRRPGDPARLAASSALIERELGWKARHSDLETMVRTALLWHERHPLGYRS